MFLQKDLTWIDFIQSIYYLKNSNKFSDDNSFGTVSFLTKNSLSVLESGKKENREDNFTNITKFQILCIKKKGINSIFSNEETKVVQQGILTTKELISPNLRPNILQSPGILEKMIGLLTKIIQSYSNDTIIKSVKMLWKLYSIQKVPLFSYSRSIFFKKTLPILMDLVDPSNITLTDKIQLAVLPLLESIQSFFFFYILYF